MEKTLKFFWKIKVYFEESEEKPCEDKVNNQHLKLLYTNANGLYGKLGQLRLIVESDAIDIICHRSEFKISQPLGKSEHVTIITDLNIFKRDGSHCHDVDDEA